MPRKSRRNLFKRPKQRRVIDCNDETTRDGAQERDSKSENPGTSNQGVDEARTCPVDTRINVEEVLYDPSPKLYLSEERSSDVILTAAIVSAGIRKLSCDLPTDWICSADMKGFYVLHLNSGCIKAIQRQIFISFSGRATAYVHCQPCPLLNDVFRFVHTPVMFSLDSLDNFCMSILALVEVVMQYSVCVGANLPDSKEFWSTIPNSKVDLNPYLESSYSSDGYGETLRSLSCSLLVSSDSDEVRCGSCAELVDCITKKISSKVS